MTTQFRFNRGSFSESMENVVAVNSKEELLFQIRRFAGMSEIASASADELMFRDTGPESRNGWANSFLVMLRGYPMGFTNGDFSEPNAYGEEAQPPVNESLLVQQAMQKAEAEHNINILAARIMGSHCWGTANGNSDYDIQFVYVRRLDDYLGFLPHKQIRYETTAVVNGAGAHLDVIGYELTRFIQMLSKTDMMASQFMAAKPTPWVSEALAMGEIHEMFNRTRQPNILIRKYLGHAKASFYASAVGPWTNRMALLMLSFAVQVRTLGGLQHLNLDQSCDLFLPTLKILRREGQVVDFDRNQFAKILQGTDGWDLSYPPRSDEELEEINNKAKSLVRRYAGG